MNTKIGFLLLLVLLIILMLFYYIDLESNIIILLAVVIVLVIHNLITRKEHFSIKDSAVALDSKLDTLLSIAQALKRPSSTNDTDKSNIAEIQLESSCPFVIDTSSTPVQDVSSTDVTNSMFKIGAQGRNLSTFGNLTAGDIRDQLTTTTTRV